jgi:hypothetical protein
MPAPNPRRGFVTLLATLLALPGPADAIPTFARRYRVTCQLCHNPVPALTEFGEVFAGNGYRMSPGEEPRDTLWTGDPLLALTRDLPLAMRLDAYAQAYSRGRASTDFQTPWIIKLLASAPLSRSLSYYMYVNLLERGEFGGFEDAVLIANDLAGLPVDLTVGQFQVTDALFKRELRVSFEDYAIYRAHVGLERGDLTYDRGLMAAVDLLGVTAVAMLVNGNGIGPAVPDRHYDSDGFKTVAGHISRGVTGFLRVGAFGYAGRSRSDGATNRLTFVGGDATLEAGPVQINLQYLHREDTNPRYAPNPPRTVRTDGGFVELLYRPGGSRWHAHGLYNWVTSSAPLVDVRLGGPPDVRRYQTITAGLGYLLQRNVRLTSEATHDMEQKRTRWTLGAVTAF